MLETRVAGLSRLRWGRSPLDIARLGGDVPFVIALTIYLHFPDSGSLKGKRKELLSVRSALSRRFGASVAEVDDQDLWQRATLAATLVSRTAGDVEHVADAIERLLARPLSRERAGRAPARVVSGPDLRRRRALCKRSVIGDRIADGLTARLDGEVAWASGRTRSARPERGSSAPLSICSRGRGYDRTTVEDVAATAGVSARTAFRYFPAKADLVFGDSDADLAALAAQLAAQDRSLPAFEATRVALVEFSQRIGTPINAERARVIEANPTLVRTWPRAARGLGRSHRRGAGGAAWAADP